MRLLISGLAGILTACLIFTALVLPRSNLEMMLGSPSPPKELPPLLPINVKLAISGFTEPKGIGSQALLTVSITSSVNASNVVLQLSLSKACEVWASSGIKVVSGVTSWSGDLIADVPVIINVIVNATEIGYGRIVAEATWGWDGLSSAYLISREYGLRDIVGIVVLEDEILVFEDYYGVLPIVFPPGSNPTPPGIPPDFNATIPDLL